MKREKIVRQIAQDLYLREDVVDEVLERWTDIAVEEIVNTGEFRFYRLFHVTSMKYKAYEGGMGHVPAHWRLKIKLSEGVRRLFKMRFSKFSGEDGHITRDNWRDYLDAGIEEDKTSKKTALHNPLLDELSDEDD